ncbi:MAG TPA: A/G-specific adenine glycosylase [Candidatus Hydrogenedentes bacterium]|nr:A/G-specific adenine glycosylase [Candidatus Hydrogenedentota bacterium]
MPSRKSKPPTLEPKAFRRALLAWYRVHARDLPWRRTRDPYAIWLSEILLQQTRVDQGLPYYERFVETFPTVEALAAANEDRVLKAWEGLGYYSRARNLHKAAKVVVHERRGEFPQSAEAWQELPGVGRYTAGAIASIAFEERAPVLDGNVIRVLSRLYDIEESTDDVRVRNHLWQLMDALVPAKHPGDFNQAMMELGARICTPKSPACATCPVAIHCAARAKGVQEIRPVRKTKQPTPRHEMVAAAICVDGRYLLLKRRAAGLLGGMWELPVGRVNSGETHTGALARTVGEQLGVKTKVRGSLATVQHAYTHFKVTVTVYACDIVEGVPAVVEHDELRWVARSEFKRYALPKVVHKFIAVL